MRTQAAGCKHTIIDWREFQPDIEFKCTCGAPMVVAVHAEPEPDGIRRDALSCTVSGKVGLTKEEGAPVPSVISAVQLRCSRQSQGCRHTDCMNSPFIMGQLPGAPL